ncbi:MAG: methyltransferase domain-containing protein [Planctomycetota bacterium]|jgi:SAM-dependent methyltransferase
MREQIKDFVRIVAENLPIQEPIHEFGSLQVPSQGDFGDLRPIFPGKEFVGCDILEGPGVDMILDLHKIDLPSESVGTVLILDTLEHVEFPRKAIEEVHRIIRPGGIIAISSTMNMPIHDYPSDYWRFTPEAFKSLLSVFANSAVGFCGAEYMPSTVAGIGVKDSQISIENFSRELELWRLRWKPRRWKTAVKQIIPPVLLKLFRKLRRKS